MDLDRFTNILDKIQATLSNWEKTREKYDLTDEMVAEGKEIIRQAKEANGR